jgi:hypothetical protein
MLGHCFKTVILAYLWLICRVAFFLFILPHSFSHMLFLSHRFPLNFTYCYTHSLLYPPNHSFISTLVLIVVIRIAHLKFYNNWNPKLSINILISLIPHAFPLFLLYSCPAHKIQMVGSFFAQRSIAIQCGDSFWASYQLWPSVVRTAKRLLSNVLFIFKLCCF